MNISAGCGISYKATSKHLGILYQADVLDRFQRQSEMRYRISASLPPLASAVMNNLSK